MVHRGFLAALSILSLTTVFVESTDVACWSLLHGSWSWGGLCTSYRICILLMLASGYRVYSVGAGRIPDTPLWRPRKDEDASPVNPHPHHHAIPRHDPADEERFLVLRQNAVWPVEPSLSVADRSLLRSLSFVERKRGGTRRWCSRCQAFKPDRAHHCIVCKQCTLMMDHHCSMLGVCIGFFNYKFHFLVIVYAALSSSLGAIIVLCTSAPLEDEYGRWVTYPRWLLGFFNVALSVMLMLYCRRYILCMQLGVTTLENVEKVKTKNPAFQLALVKHRQRSMWRMCLGDSVWDWWNPFAASRREGDDGLFLRPIHRRRRTFLLGTQSRAGENSAVLRSLARSTMFDKQVLREVWAFMN